MNVQLPQLGDAPNAPFPETSTALRHPNGLLAWGGDFHPERILAAYHRGIFPWYAEDEPILWWSPAPRCVLRPGDVHLSRRTRRRYHTGDYRITADTAFSEVIKSCAAPRRDAEGTWISAPLQASFTALHNEGHAHSIEVWRGELLVGGLYGLALGRMFFGESMFSRESDGSKLALVALCKQLHAWDFPLLDCQVPNPHLRSMGAVSLSRNEFESTLERALRLPFEAGHWTKRFQVASRW
jgi:leucyl/phenylalanyl-tRNA--protein transferase